MASRSSRWRNWNPWSPARRDGAGRSSSRRTRAWSRAGTGPAFRRRRQLDHGALLEHLAGDRGPFQHRPLGLLEPVQAGGEQRLDAGRDAQVVEVGRDPVAVLAAQPALLDQGGQQLLEEQRVALGRPGDPPGGRLGGQGDRAGQGGQQPGRLGLAEGLQQQGGGVQLAPGPAGPLLQELGPGHGHQQDGGAAAVVGHVLDQVEQARLGPVEVVEHHHQRPPLGQQLQQPPERPGRLLGRAGGGLQPDELGDPGGDVLALAVPGPGSPTVRGGVQQPAQLGPGLGRGVGVGDAGGLADDLGHRPVGDALAVGQAAAAQHGRPREGGHGLADQPGLAHAGLAEHGQQVAAAGADDPLVHPGEQAQLGLATHDRGVLAAGVAGGARVDLAQPVGDHRGALALEEQRRDPLGGDRVPDQAVGRLAEQHLAGGGDLLEAGGHVDGVAQDQGVADGRVAGDDLAGVDPGADLQRAPPSRAPARR